LNHLYTIISEESLLIPAKIKEIENKYKDNTYEKTIIDLEDSSMATLLNEINTIPFLEDYRMVILRSPWQLYEENDKQLDNDEIFLVNKFKDYLDNPCDTTILIMVFEKKIKSSLYTLLQNQSTLYKIDKIKTDNLNEYIKDRFNRDGFEISNSAINEIVLRVTSDSFRIENEIAKLELYKHNDPKIEIGDVRLLVSKDLEDNIYNLSSAIVAGNKLLAMDIYDEMKKLGIAPTVIIANLISTFDLLYQTKVLIKNGLKKEEIAQLFNMKPGRVYYLVKDASGLSLDAIKNNIDTLVDMDYKIKSGQLDDSVGLEIFILKR